MLGSALAQESSSDSAASEDLIGTRSLRIIKNMLSDLSCQAGNCVNHKEFRDALRGYGCNCFSNDPNMEWDGNSIWHFTSRGEPVDEVDDACKEAFKRYKCLEQDFTNGLISDDTICSVGMDFEYFMSDNGEIICGTVDNPEYANQPERNGCKLAACEIERAFSLRIFNSVGNEVTGKGKLKFPDNNKDNYNVECSARPGPPRDACCGEYPERKPYSSELQSCCENGLVRSFGTC